MYLLAKSAIGQQTRFCVNPATQHTVRKPDLNILDLEIGHPRHFSPDEQFGHVCREDKEHPPDNDLPTADILGKSGKATPGLLPKSAIGK